MTVEEEPGLYEIRIGGCASAEEALARQESVARALCPDAEHPGPCEVPWGFTLGDDDALVLGVYATATRAAEVAGRVGGVLVGEGDSERFAAVVEQYRVERG
ncbi:hypothetical protein [Streptomyces sp. URMC 129]|uniref:hypothetical protein n=1 Tax=Streptomyces sp. URMC 129 TaxID=3423407 RepID=UPI003F1B3E8C